MDLSIIILNYNQKNFLMQCLRNIEEANLKLAYEVIILDNASKDRSRKMLEKIEKIEETGISKGDREGRKENNINKEGSLKIILNKKNLGYAKANNIGIKIAKGEYILILNPDVIIVPNVLEKIVGYLKEHPEIGILGPQLLNPNGEVQYSCFRFPKWYIPFLRRSFLGGFPWLKDKLAKYLYANWDHQSIKEVDWLLGACLLAKRDFLLNNLNGFDEKYFLYFDDVDLCQRCRQKSKKVVYYPKVSLCHFHQRMSAKHLAFPSLFSKITWIHILSALKYFKKWGSG